jgi:hypothetical protein
MNHKPIQHTIEGTSKRSTTQLNIRSNIMKIVEKSQRPVSTQEIGDQIDRAWHSIQMHCLKLQLEGKIDGFRVGNMNLWTKTKSQR